MGATYLHVAAAVISNHLGEILITKRLDHLHQGGKWEFPGGKLEAGETPQAALQRELEEELGIVAVIDEPVIQVRHDYPEKSVLLDVWQVRQFEGHPEGKEGQEFRWVAPSGLAQYRFPEANIPILKAVTLPQEYLITPEPGSDSAVFLAKLDAVLAQGIALVQLRAKSLAPNMYLKLAKHAVELCHRHGARLLINGEPEWLPDTGADGVHLTSNRLHACTERPLSRDCLVAASCHTPADIAQAEKIETDFIVVSPVKKTVSHPQSRALGWQTFRELCNAAHIPVYALGGMSSEDITEAKRAGGQGIAAISGLWEKSV